MTLTAEDVAVEFTHRKAPPAHALAGVNLTVSPGEVVAIVGESGSGKTTLARTLMGLEQPTRGRVLHDGQPLSYSPRGLKAFRRRVQMVLQDPAGALNPRHTVYESVAEGLRLHDVVRNDPDGRSEAELVATALAEAGLRPPERLFLRYPHELSGGQRQRVLVAGALALRPELLIADEPVSSLDASIRGEILALLLRLRDDLGLGVLVVTHDLGLAWNVADRIAVMYLGRVVEQGSTEEVLQAPRHPYTRALLSVLVIGGALFALLATTMREDAQYFKKVDEIMPQAQAWYGKRLQLHGYVVEGTIERRPNSFDHRFKVRNGESVVLASYTGLLPDTFKDGAEVVLRGQLAADGFHVDRGGVTAKCPSKYEEAPAIQ